MDIIILANNKEIEFTEKLESVNTITLIITDKTVEELEEIFSTENLERVQIKHNDEIIGIYENLECVNINRIIKSKQTLVNLNKNTTE